MGTADERYVGVVLSGRYRIIRGLGRGGMGSVFEATHVDLGGRVAVKVLHSQLTLDDDTVTRFRREAQVAAALSHPHIARVLDMGVEPDGTMFMVQELITGSTLTEVLRDQAPLEPDRVLRLAIQMLSALGAVHQAGVVHRDVKPSNVMLTTGYDGGEMVKLLDFGVARLLEASRLTSTGQLIGTPTYMAPEQMRGVRVDARADIYAVGAVAYGALAGRPPYEGRSYAEIVNQMLTQTRIPLTRLRPELGELGELVERAMAPDPDGRFQTADQMASSLSRLASAMRGGQVVATLPAHPVTRAPNRRLVGLAVGLAVATLGVMGIGAWIVVAPPASPSMVLTPSTPPMPVSVSAAPVLDAGAVAVWPLPALPVSDAGPSPSGAPAGDEDAGRRRSRPVSVQPDSGPTEPPAQPPPAAPPASPPRVGHGPRSMSLSVRDVTGDFDEATMIRLLTGRVGALNACLASIPADEAQPDFYRPPPWTIQINWHLRESGGGNRGATGMPPGRYQDCVSRAFYLLPWPDAPRPAEARCTLVLSE